MLTLYDRDRGRMCDGVSRRSFLQIGAMGAAGITLPQILAREAQAGVGKSHKAIINIFLPGGPPHQDMFDLKVDAPSEIRGEFSPIKTNVSGIEICELLPEMAKLTDKLAIIRSIVGASGGHDSFQCMTGRKKQNEPAGGMESTCHDCNTAVVYCDRLIVCDPIWTQVAA